MGPALLIAFLVGAFHTAIYVFYSRRFGLRTVLVLAAAFLGAWAGDAIGGRLNVDPIRIGDFHLLAASIVAWGGIAYVSVTSVIGQPARGDR